MITASLLLFLLCHIAVVAVVIAVVVSGVRCWKRERVRTFGVIQPVRIINLRLGPFLTSVASSVYTVSSKLFWQQ